jgi:hypothetical protein
MKTAVGLIATTILTIVATGASAEWRLYVNRDNKAWSLERAFVSSDECDHAARTLYRSGQALGVGCAEYPAPASGQAPTPRPAQYSQSNPAQRHVVRADDPARTSASRSSVSRVAERPGRSTARPAPVAEPIASVPAAVIFPPSGGIEIRQEEPPRPAVVAQAVPQPRRQSAPAAARPNPVTPPSTDDDKDSVAVALAKAATEAAAASAREAEAEAAKREAAITTDKAERRTTLAVFGGVTLVILASVAYSVYRVARTSPLRGLALGLIEVGVITAALAYPVVALWTRLKISESGLSWMPGLLAGIVIAGVGVIVMALEFTRKPSRSTAAGASARDAERKPQAPVELIKPGEYVKTGEPSKPAEPVTPLQPVRPLEPVASLEAPRPVEIPKWAKPPEVPKTVESVKPV